MEVLKEKAEILHNLIKNKKIIFFQDQVIEDSYGVFIINDI